MLWWLFYYIYIYMKKLVLIPFLFLCMRGNAQSIYSEILSKTVLIDGLEVPKQDFPTKMTWKEAKTVCDSLGNGWRLPNLEELNILYRNQQTIGGFAKCPDCYYWSNRIIKKDETIGWFKDFDKGHIIFQPRNNPKKRVRIVRNWILE